MAAFHFDFAFFFQNLPKSLKTNILLEVWIFVDKGGAPNRIIDSRIEIGVNESSKSHHFIKRMHKLTLLYSYLTNSLSGSRCAIV